MISTNLKCIFIFTMEKMAKIFSLSLSLSLWGKTMTIVFKFQLLDRMLPLQNKTAWSARYLEKKKDSIRGDYV